MSTITNNQIALQFAKASNSRQLMRIQDITAQALKDLGWATSIAVKRGFKFAEFINRYPRVVQLPDGSIGVDGLDTDNSLTLFAIPVGQDSYQLVVKSYRTNTSKDLGVHHHEDVRRVVVERIATILKNT
jgi:hypothetical protein